MRDRARVSHLSQRADCCEPYGSILIAKHSCERGLEIYGTVAAVIDGTIDSRHWWDTVTEVCRRIGAAAAPAVFVIAAMTLVITEVVEYIMVLSEKMYEDLQRTKKERHEKSRKEGFEEGRKKVYEEVGRWNQRGLDAAAKGEPFDEPLPTLAARNDD